MSGYTLAAIAAVLLAYPLLERLLGRAVPAAIYFVVAGVLLGPDVADVLTPGSDGEPLRLLAEATLAIVLFSDASKIDLGTLRQEASIPARLLGIGLPLTVVAGLAVGVVLLGGLGWSEALVLAVVLAPTDAALGQAVVTDERLPSRVRQGLSVESGLNDGLCVPILFAAIAIADSASDVAHGLGPVQLFAEAVGYGALGGVVGGAAGGFVLRAIRRHREVDRIWAVLVGPVSAALAYGLAAGPGGSGFIGAFVGGMVFRAVVSRTDAARESPLLEDGGALLGAATFIAFGALVAVPVVQHMTAAQLAYAVLSLTVVRMVPVAIACIGAGLARGTVAYLGWFGPRGLASIVFAIIVVQDSGLPHEREIVAVAVLTVLLSVVAHGLTAAPLTARLVAALRPREDPAGAR